MIDYKEDLKFEKQERDRIKSEINDLQARIVVAGGRRRNRQEVNDLRRRISSLKMRLNEVLDRIEKLEKIIRNGGQGGQIQVVPNNPLGMPPIDNGVVTAQGSIAVTRTSPETGEVIGSVGITIQKTNVYSNGDLVSSKQTRTKTCTGKNLGKENNVFLESSIVE